MFVPLTQSIDKITARKDALPNVNRRTPSGGDDGMQKCHGHDSANDEILLSSCRRVPWLVHCHFMVIQHDLCMYVVVCGGVFAVLVVM
jgi:hypothetical protein